MHRVETPELLALEGKAGRTFTIHDWAAIRTKSDKLTFDDLIVIRAFEGPEKADSLMHGQSNRTTAKGLDLLRIEICDLFNKQMVPLLVRISELETEVQRLGGMECENVRLKGLYTLMGQRVEGLECKANLEAWWGQKSVTP